MNHREEYKKKTGLEHEYYTIGGQYKPSKDYVEWLESKATSLEDDIERIECDIDHIKRETAEYKKENERLSEVAFKESMHVSKLHKIIVELQSRLKQCAK